MTTVRSATAWRSVLDGLHADRLDCLQANLAVLADLAHGAGTHLRLGRAAGGFRARRAGLGDLGDLPIAAPGLDDRLAEAALAGLAVAERHRDVTGPDLRSMAADAAWYVVADAYHLPWVEPYHGREHVEHSFLLSGDAPGVTVVDGYQLDSPAGRARPGTWRLSAADLDAALPAGAAHAIRLVPVAPAAGWVPPESAVGVDEYVAAYRDLPDRGRALRRLTVETWTMARGWGLAAAYTRDVAVADHSAAVADLAERVYLASRRVDRGRPEPPGWPERLAELLHHAPPVAEPVGLPRSVRDLVVEVAARVLGLPAGRIRGLCSLAELPVFNSFRMLDIVEQVEAALGVELAPAELTPANLADLDVLTGLFARRVTESGGPR